MWLLDMEKFLLAAEEIGEARVSRIAGKKDRVIKLLMGDEEFLASLSLESLADIINNDAQEVFEEYDRELITCERMEGLQEISHMSRRRIL